MRVEFLGTGGFHPNDRRHTACVMLPEVGVILDAGTSLFRVPEKLETKDVDIFLTHAHLDHVVGLPSLLVPMMDGDIQTARVHASPITIKAVREHLLAEPFFPIVPGYEYYELQEEFSVPGEGVVRHKKLEHPGGTVGYRIDWPEKSLAYITDTTVDGSYHEFVSGVDLLIHECYFSDDMAHWSKKTGHSNTTPVAQLAKDARVGKLMLIHINPMRTDDDPIGLETARSIFPQTEIAEDRMTVEI